MDDLSTPFHLRKKNLKTHPTKGQFWVSVGVLLSIELALATLIYMRA